jgi:hypothetical protein
VGGVGGSWGIGHEFRFLTELLCGCWVVVLRQGNIGMHHERITASIKCVYNKDGEVR